jgi:hypothetical protein
MKREEKGSGIQSVVDIGGKATRLQAAANDTEIRGLDEGVHVESWHDG